MRKDFAVIERRATLRHKSIMQARVFYNHRQSSMDCVVRNFSEAGANLQFAEVVSLPDGFEVYIPSKDQYFQAHLIWRKGQRAGISWVAEEMLHPPLESGRSASPLADRVTHLEHEVALLRKRLDAIQG
jgi:hypothetical protein